tara:strand:+ start:1018 stop:2094 length:1077 start_codon:yes stop_codon:yes gene_type:complete
MMNILVTAAGSPGFINVNKAIKSSRELLGKVVVHGCDINKDSIGLKMISNTFVAPRGDSEEYVSCIYNYCKKNNIDLLIPCADEELLPLSRSKSIFDSIGCNVLVSDPPSLQKCLDKGSLYKFCSDNDLQQYIVKHRVCNDIDSLLDSYKHLNSLGHKVCVKPSKTHGSRGFRLIEDGISKKDFFDKKPSPHAITLDSLCDILTSDGSDTFPELLVMEYLPGQEYSVDCYKRTQDFLCVTRTRDVIKEGICVSGQTIENKELIRAAKKIYEKIGLLYNANIQFRYDQKGDAKLLEINPRFSGTMEHCRASGINFVEVAVHNIMQLKEYDYTVRWGVKMNRVWSEIFQSGNGFFTLGGL